MQKIQYILPLNKFEDIYEIMQEKKINKYIFKEQTTKALISLHRKLADPALIFLHMQSGGS